MYYVETKLAMLSLWLTGFSQALLIWVTELNLSTAELLSVSEIPVFY